MSIIDIYIYIHTNRARGLTKGKDKKTIVKGRTPAAGQLS